MTRIHIRNRLWQGQYAKVASQTNTILQLWAGLKRTMCIVRVFVHVNFIYNIELYIKMGPSLVVFHSVRGLYENMTLSRQEFKKLIKKSFKPVFKFLISYKSFNFIFNLRLCNHYEAGHFSTKCNLTFKMQ